MTENVQKKQNPARALVLALVALIVVGGIVLVLVQRNGSASESAAPTSTATSDPTAPTDANEEGEDDVQGMTPGPSLGPTTFLEKEMGGQEAIDALGDKIEKVAERNGKTVEELTDLLLRDQTAVISPRGFLLFKDDFGKKDS